MDSDEHARKAAQTILRLLDEGRAKTGLSRHPFFTQTLRVWDATSRQVDMDEYLNVACVGVEKAFFQINGAFEELFAQATENYYDILGMLYMLAELGSKGEEYTPFDLVRLIIRLTMGDYSCPEPGGNPLTICDPCCGSGSLLLGAAEYIDETHPELLDTGMVRFYGQDISYDAWLMTRLNLHLHGLGRCVRRPSMLSQKEQEAVERVMNTPPLMQATLPFPGETQVQSGQRQPSKGPRRTHRSPARTPQPPHTLGPLFATTEPLFEMLSEEKTLLPNLQPIHSAQEEQQPEPQERVSATAEGQSSS